MITLSEKAAGKIGEIMKEQGEPNAALRVIVTGMSCSGPQYMMTLEQEQAEDDRVIQSAGLKLLLDPDSADALEGSTIDYLETLERSGFTIINPNSSTEGGSGGGCGGNCACGK